MTTAICCFCGAMKFGVLLPCKACGGVPQDPLDRAYAFAFSDHHVPADVLEELSRNALAEGVLPGLTPEDEAAFVAAYGRLGAPG